MKNQLLIILFIISMPACLAQEGYPEPPDTHKRLFYIQHSKNHNTYVYDANFSSSTRINDSDPIDVYQIDYKKDGTREELTALQRKMAYGITFNRVSENRFEFTLAAYPEKTLTLALHSGHPVVTVNINGKDIQLERMFLHCNALGTGVSKIEFYGKDLKTKKKLTEIMYISK
ncbi:DUF4833 domain-containing protein [Flavobacterium alkalisoli]|uniref:DUF4833 domain-containing protein n=1 Tax=Flavobacterium alkalisoli TaxID=2602769 RepID=A0A5B9FYE2_9FLAO|nr:DUF4833 domain-containing protein [Flavobacterium alkalisoli]QEE51409.1 DUF4833 domain-containing protein [Flavobacterium alkalisoli]